MKGKTHKVVAAAIGMFVSRHQPINDIIVTIFSAILGGIVPDIDHSRNSFNQKILGVKNDLLKTVIYSIIGIIVGYIGYEFENRILFILSIIILLTGLSKHRGFTHSLIGILFINILIKEVSIKSNSENIYIGFMYGYISHIVLDLFTKDGIRVLYPFKGQISLPMKLKSNGIFEKLISKIAFIYSIYFILKITGIIQKDITETLISFFFIIGKKTLFS